MGTASSKKFIKNNLGSLTEEAALTTSAGAGDADKIPALNGSGVLDDTIINASAASAPNKVVKQTGAGVIDPTVLNAAATGGGGNANKIAQLNGSGKIDITMIPSEVGAVDAASLATSENLASGDLVNIYNNGGTATARKADANTAGKEAHGYVLAATTSPAAATVYFEGSNTGVTGLTPGVQFLSAATPGKTVITAPTGTGKIVQKVGFAVGAGALNFQCGEPIVLA